MRQPHLAASGHAASSAEFTQSGRTLTMTVNADRPDTGVCDYVASSGAPALVTVQDAGAPSVAAIQGVLERE